MFQIDQNNVIKMVQGDTAAICLSLTDYVLSDGDEVIFGLTGRKIVQPTSTFSLRDVPSELLVRKSVTNFDEQGRAHIVLESSDTLYLTPGHYLYEIQVNTKDGRVDTVITTTKFTILEGIIIE